MDWTIADVRAWLASRYQDVTDADASAWEAYLRQKNIDPRTNPAIPTDAGAPQQDVQNYDPRGNVPVPEQPWATAPEGWQGNRWVPNADWSPGVQYQESLNASIPWLSPEDQTWAMQYLSAQQPETYGSKLDTGAKYNQVALNANVKELTPEEYYNYGNANRFSSAKAMLTENWNPDDPNSKPVVDPTDEPLTAWINQVLDTANAYGTNGEQVGNRRTREQQARYDTTISDLLSAEGAATYGVQNTTAAPVYDMWSEYFRRLLAPTTTRPPVSEKAAVPTWRSNSYTGSQSGMNRGYGYQNTNWG
jgi:hypothetical protein